MFRYKSVKESVNIFMLFCKCKAAYTKTLNSMYLV